MSYKKVISLARRFMIKLAIEEELTNPGRENIGPAFVEHLNVPIELQQKILRERQPISEEERITPPGIHPAPELRDVSDKVSKYAKCFCYLSN